MQIFRGLVSKLLAVFREGFLSVCQRSLLAAGTDRGDKRCVAFANLWLIEFTRVDRFPRPERLNIQQSWTLVD